MVTHKVLERYMDNIEQIAKDANTEPAAVKRVIKAIESDLEKRRRKPKPPIPNGGISIRAASRKYNIPSPTISRWVKAGYIPILLRTKNELYITETILSKIISYYKQSAGQGKKSITKLWSQCDITA